MVVLRPYDPADDAPAVYRLWQQALGDLWPLPYEMFQLITLDPLAYHQGDHLVAVSGDEIVGFIAVQISPEGLSAEGTLLVLLVAPAYQRRGIGRRLHDQAMSALKQSGVEKVHLGRGWSYFWQGVPVNLPGAWAFFAACGWQEVERSFDMIGDLAGYRTPAHIFPNLRRPTIAIAPATQGDAEAILAFEALHFPGWLRFYQRIVEHQSYADMVIAKDSELGIVGAACLVDQHVSWWQPDIRWLRLLGEQTGGVGVLGVAEPMREQGIGLALAARATECLRERGLAKSYLGWTWLVDWYGKLGYRVWQEYRMSSRHL